MKAFFAGRERAEKFKLRTVNSTDDQGYTRRGCPALREYGPTLGCPRRDSVDLVGPRGLYEVFTPPAEPRPKVCAQESVTIPADVAARSMGGLTWATEPWYDSFHRRRPRVEGTNGKNPAVGALQKMRFRVRGRARASILIGFLTAAMNDYLLRLWQEQCERVTGRNDRAAGHRRSRKPRRTHTRQQLTAGEPVTRGP